MAPSSDRSSKTQKKPAARKPAVSQRPRVATRTAARTVEPGAIDATKSALREAVEQQMRDDLAELDKTRDTIVPAEVTLDRRPVGDFKPVSRRRAVQSTSAMGTAVTERLTRGVRNKDVTAFMRQLIMLIEAGTPLLKALKTLQQRGEHRGIRNLVAGMAEYVEAGNPLWQAFAREPRVFGPVDINLIKASEASGTLPVVLQRMVRFRERRELMRKRVAGAMVYPIMLVLACAAVIILIAKVVLPAIVEMFRANSIEITGLSARFLNAMEFLGNYWWIGLVVVAIVVLVYFAWWRLSPVRRMYTDRMKLWVPVLRSIVRKSAVAEFCSTLSLMLRSGLTMLTSLDLCRATVSNRAYQDAIQSLRSSVERGEGLESALREAEKSGLFPGVVVDMLATGEETGKVDVIAELIADRYEEEVRIEVETMGDVLVPAVVVFIGLVVVLTALALLGPFFALIEGLQSGTGI